MWVSKCGPWTRGIYLTWELVRKADSQAPSESELNQKVVGGLGNICFDKPSKGFCCMLRFENHCWGLEDSTDLNAFAFHKDNLAICDV
jgi:hypothetical protein